MNSGGTRSTVRRLAPVLIVAMAFLVSAPGSSSGDDRPAVRRTFPIGRRLQQELDKPVNIVRSRSTLREIVSRLRELHGIALLLDRRIDPDQRIDVQFVQTTLRDGLSLLAAQLDAQLVTIGGTLFIGPADSTDRIRTLIALRTGEIREIHGAEAFRKLSVLLKGTTIEWNDLAEPKQVLSHIVQTFHINLLNADAIPHDLWGQGAMADVNAVEALSLLLGQFDLTFEWQARGAAIRIIPAPADVVIEKSHTSRKMSGDEAIKLIRQTWPHLQLTPEGRSVTIAATAGEHDAIDELLNPRSTARANSGSPTLGPLVNRRFTLTTTRAEVIAIVRYLKLEGTTVDYDAEALEQAGIDLRQKLTLKLDQVTADEFFTAICEPLGLTYELDDTTVRLRPK